jgi:hypothetical protein
MKSANRNLLAGYIKKVYFGKLLWTDGETVNYEMPKIVKECWRVIRSHTRALEGAVLTDMFLTENNDFKIITDFGSLYKAYQKARSGSRFTASSTKFQSAALDGIHQIKRRLETKTYKIGNYNEFVVYEPKERIIKACTFQDKIVQHSLCDNVLIPKFSKEFIKLYSKMNISYFLFFWALWILKH